MCKMVWTVSDIQDHLMSKFLSTGTGEEIPDDAEYWFYDVPSNEDCVFMYAESYSLEARTCDGLLPYICEIH